MQAALAEPAVGVAVWVRVLLPQLLGVPDLPSAAAAAHHKHSSGSGSGSGATGDPTSKPLETSLQGAAVDYVTGLLQELDVPVADEAVGVTVTPAEDGADVVCEDAGAVPTVPAAAVEALSRHLAGKPAAAAGSGGVENKKGSGAGSAALAPLLPSLAALAAGSSCQAQYSDWLLLSFESAALSDGEWLLQRVTACSGCVAAGCSVSWALDLCPAYMYQQYQLILNCRVRLRAPCCCFTTVVRLACAMLYDKQCCYTHEHAFNCCCCCSPLAAVCCQLLLVLLISW
jgi:hypothetical protein